MLNNVVSYLVDSHKFVNISNELPKDIPENYIRVKYLYCGICGGDYSRFLGYRKEYPISLGHEFVAEVLDMNCKHELSYSIGNYVVSDFNYRCMKCDYCKKGKPHLCKKNDIGLFSNRAFAVYADIHYSYLLKTNIPKEFIFRATTIEPLSCVIHAMEHYNLSNFNSILIYGCGNIGMLCAFYLYYCNNKKVYLYDQNEKKLNNVLSVFNCQKASFTRSYDLVIEATNNSLGLNECIDLCEYDQNICSFSHLYGQDTSTIYDKLVKKESTIYFPLRNGTQNTLLLATELIEKYWLSTFDQLIKIYKTSNINKVFEEKCNCSVPKQVICFTTD